MDPTNPRWQTADERWHRNATFWKIIVGATAASAFSAIAVASCLGRDAEVRRVHELDEPGYVETTAAPAAPATTPIVIVNNNAAPAPTTTADSTGGAERVGRAEATAAGTTTITGATTPFQSQAAAATPANEETAPVAGHAGHAGNDPNNRGQSQGSNPDAPSMQGGAGAFITEAPYWSSSALTPNRDAGAGTFDTERNTPAR